MDPAITSSTEKMPIATFTDKMLSIKKKNTDLKRELAFAGKAISLLQSQDTLPNQASPP